MSDYVGKGKESLYCLLPLKSSIGYGVMVNITASHAVARGSIPRIRTIFLNFFKLFQLCWSWYNIYEVRHATASSLKVLQISRISTDQCKLGSKRQWEPHNH